MVNTIGKKEISKYIILNKLDSSSIPTPTSGKSIIYTNNNGKLVVKNDDGSLIKTANKEDIQKILLRNYILAYNKEKQLNFHGMENVFLWLFDDQRTFPAYFHKDIINKTIVPLYFDWNLDFSNVQTINSSNMSDTENAFTHDETTKSSSTNADEKYIGKTFDTTYVKHIYFYAYTKQYGGDAQIKIQYYDGSSWNDIKTYTYYISETVSEEIFLSTPISCSGLRIYSPSDVLDVYHFFAGTRFDNSKYLQLPLDGLRSYKKVMLVPLFYGIEFDIKYKVTHNDFSETDKLEIEKVYEFNETKEANGLKLFFDRYFMADDYFGLRGFAVYFE